MLWSDTTHSMTTNTIYVLKLTDDNWYVGKTSDLSRRYQDHLNGKGSAWTKKYPPVSLEHSEPETSPLDEDRITKQWMMKYGLDKVRGGTYSSVRLEDDVIKFLNKEIRSAQDCCLRCGRPGHFITKCYAATDVHGKTLEEITCIRCGRLNHSVDKCTYKTTVDRKKIVDHISQTTVPSTMHCTRCGRSTHLTEDCKCKTTIDGKRLVEASVRTCTRCGRHNHLVEKCYASTTVDGKAIPEQECTGI